MNNADGRQRGKGPNPFGTYTDLAPGTTPESKGPFPGDAADYSFNLYSNADLKTRVGTAIIVCQYNFARNAFCDESFQMTDGDTLLAAGAFNFDASVFTLAITGGFGKYNRVKGEVTTTPSVHHAEKLSFELTSS